MQLMNAIRFLPKTMKSLTSVVVCTQMIGVQLHSAIIVTGLHSYINQNLETRLIVRVLQKLTHALHADLHLWSLCCHMYLEIL